MTQSRRRYLVFGFAALIGSSLFALGWYSSRLWDGFVSQPNSDDWSAAANQGRDLALFNKALAVLRQLMLSDDEAIQHAATEAVRGIKHWVALPGYFHALKTATPQGGDFNPPEYWKIRPLSFEDDYELPPEAKSLVPMLIELVRYKDSEWPEREWKVREAAAYVVARFGANAKEAVPALVKSLQDSSLGTRLEVALALATVDPSNKAGLPVAREGLTHFYARNRLLASLVIARVGNDSKAALPALLQELREHFDAKTKTERMFDVLVGLWYTGASGRDAVPLLREHAEKDEFFPRRLLTYAVLLRLDPNNEKARDFLYRNKHVLRHMTEPSHDRESPFADANIPLIARSTLETLG